MISQWAAAQTEPTALQSTSRQREILKQIQYELQKSLKSFKPFVCQCINKYLCFQLLTALTNRKKVLFNVSWYWFYNCLSSTGEMNAIQPTDIPSFCVLMMVVEGDVCHVGPESTKDIQLGWDVVDCEGHTRWFTTFSSKHSMSCCALLMEAVLWTTRELSSRIVKILKAESTVNSNTNTCS